MERRRTAQSFGGIKRRHDMAQNLPAPCFQIYAASTLASRPFRQVRGLIHTMELECWVNHRLPHDPADLAKYLGVAANEIKRRMACCNGTFQY